MKTNKLMYLLVIGLALAITATGCKKKPQGITPLPGVFGPRDEGMTQLPPSPPIPNAPENPATQNIPPTAPAQLGEYNEEPMPAETIVHFNYDSAVVKNTEKAHVEAAVQALRADQVVKIRI